MALMWLREGASALSWKDPSNWGTHAFRRGAAREAFQYGGLAALMHAGGWKSRGGAMRYLEKRQLSALEQAEYIIELSDEEGEDHE